jgi:hypothetical protein
MGMYNIETLKSALQHWTGLGRPAKRAARGLVRPRKPQARRFADDGVVPNHPRFAFIHYRGAVELRGAPDPAAVFERLFEMNGWSGAWRNGIYDYVHYHPRTHEVLGLKRVMICSWSVPIPPPENTTSSKPRRRSTIGRCG